MATPFSRRPKEGEPYAIIKFIVTYCSGQEKTFMVESNLCSLCVKDLKDDFQSLLGIPGYRQRWYFHGTSIDDDKTLWEQGLGLGFNWSDDDAVIVVTDS